MLMAEDHRLNPSHYAFVITAEGAIWRGAQMTDVGGADAFGHRHKKAEEVYVVLAGDGKIHLDDEEVAVERLDAIRVGPEVTRGFEAGDEGLELIVFSKSAPGDAEIVEDFFDD